MARATGGNPFAPKNMFMVVFVALIALYLWSQFVSDSTFAIPATAQIESITFNIIKILIIVTAVYIGYAVVTRVTDIRLLSRRDIMGLIVLGVVVYIVWNYIIVGFDLLNVTSFEDLTYKSMQKLGLG